MAYEDEELRFEEFVESLPQIVYEIGTQARFTFTDRMGLKAFGYTDDDPAFRITTADVLVPAGRQSAYDSHRQRGAGRSEL